MTKIFAYPNPTDPNRVCIATILDESLDPYLIHPDGVLVDEEAFPDGSKDYFDAMVLTPDKTLEINFEKAPQLTVQRLRSERQPLLEHLDVLYQRAIESSRAIGPIEAEKQRLRDITLLPTSCTTLDELRQLKAESTLRFEELPTGINISDNLALLKENEGLQQRVADMQAQLASITLALRKKFIL